MYSIEYTYLSHPGRFRSRHEDNLICLGRYLAEGNTGTDSVSGQINVEGPRIFGVFDGMGGEDQGEMAALMAARTMAGWNFSGRGTALIACCREANRRIVAYTEEHELRCCGATAALLLLDEKGAVTCNLGDSRIYRMRNGEMSRLSEDHNLPMYGGKKGPLIQYLGLPETESLLEPAIMECPVQDGDLFILCTDGLTDMVPEERIAELCWKAGNPFDRVRTLREDEEEGDETVRIAGSPLEKAGKMLLETALEAGGRDNVTILLVRVIGSSVEKVEKAGFFRRLLG